MPLKKDEAYVLDVRKLPEADRLLVFFTREEGKLKGVARSAARSRRRFGGKLERLSRVRVSYFDREGRDLLRIDSCDLLEESFTLHGDLAKAALLSYIAEIVDTFSREREADPRYFRLLTSVMGAVREGVDVAMLARYFEVWTLKLHGLFPSLSRCDSCGRDVSACGGYLTVAEMPRFTCPSCGGREPSNCVAVSARAITLLGQIRTLAPADLTRLRPDRVALEEMEKAAVAMLNAFVGHPFRSYRFLREVRAL